LWAAESSILNLIRILSRMRPGPLWHVRCQL
jgi:hypothetical protein